MEQANTELVPEKSKIFLGTPELDLPPEYCRYRDEGCDLASSCLNCPFPKCVYDQPRGRQRWLKRWRDWEIVRLFNTDGKRVKELALIFGLSQRTVQRALRDSLSTSPPRSPSPYQGEGEGGSSEGLRPSATPSYQPCKGKGTYYERGAQPRLDPLDVKAAVKEAKNG